MERSRTKLVCTIGPATADRVGDLVAAGMDVARVNFSHGTPDDHKAYVHAVRAAAHSARRSVAVLVDLPGPKIRLGELEGGAVTLETGATFTLRSDTQAQAAATDVAVTATAPPDAADLVTELTGADDASPPSDDDDDTAGSAMTVSEPASVPSAIGDASSAHVSARGLAAMLEVGDRVLLADGAAELRVTAISGSAVATEVIHGGMVRSRSGVNIPSSRLTGYGLTDDDRAAIPRALELRADLIAQSFVRSAEDVKALRALLPADGPRVVAKIETRAAVDGFDGILEVADGIMVARGDLGVDIPFEEVPLIQKQLIERASNADRFTIVATQMLESMTGAPRPTRAEASDVANAVLDGADAVMLSAETAIGAYPVEALQAMAAICRATEKGPEASFVSADEDKSDPPKAMVLAAAVMSGLTEVGAIWCFTRSGRTAELLSFTRPSVPIVAFTLSPIIARRLAVRRGVIPMILPAAGKGESLIERMEAAWRTQRDRSSYQSVVLVTTSQQPAGINRIEIHRLG
ncbi:MAG: pyruvate kinase [Chloroflexota bacterium]